MRVYYMLEYTLRTDDNECILLAIQQSPRWAKLIIPFFTIQKIAYANEIAVFEYYYLSDCNV